MKPHASQYHDVPEVWTRGEEIAAVVGMCLAGVLIIIYIITERVARALHRRPT